MWTGDVSEEQSLFVCLKRCTKATKKLCCAFSPTVNKYSIFFFRNPREKGGERGGRENGGWVGMNVCLCRTYAVEFIWRTACGNQFSLSTMSVLGIELWYSGLTASSFSCQTVLQAPNTHFLNLACVFESILILEFPQILQVSRQITL